MGARATFRSLLGLEVKQTGSKVDMNTPKLAKRLTDGLRKRAAMARGDFSLAPNSNKDLLEMKLLGNCDDEGAGCMATKWKEEARLPQLPLLLVWWHS